MTAAVTITGIMYNFPFRRASSQLPFAVKISFKMLPVFDDHDK